MKTSSLIRYIEKNCKHFDPDKISKVFFLDMEEEEKIDMLDALWRNHLKQEGRGG